MRLRYTVQAKPLLPVVSWTAWRALPLLCDVIPPGEIKMHCFETKSQTSLSHGRPSPFELASRSSGVECLTLFGHQIGSVLHTTQETAPVAVVHFRNNVNQWWMRFHWITWCGRVFCIYAHMSAAKNSTKSFSYIRQISSINHYFTDTMSYKL